ncbi:UDP-forming cellulose synthase catalytic subunit [Asaia bogorensis]|uniref:UDP-forming cellulose synthase catalytic subunit n=1 Tax=Asaia bogorensis TaxID=91915 RepID=UPI000EFAD95E|nr:UDP-forming cellulose synthase catalytic subunit [Asaia bogorensis]
MKHVRHMVAILESWIDDADHSAGRTAVKTGLVAFAILCMIIAAFVHLNLAGQTLVCVFGIVLFMLVNRHPGPRATLVLKGLSIIVSLRYLSWRLTETLNFSTWTQSVLGIVLVLAEIYAFVMLILSYFQTLHPLERKVTPMPKDVSLWPSVDIYIPTYNEELRIVRQTVLAAMGIDWPSDRINVYLLDDGHREEFREFAESCGAGYIARSEHNHAKAGNLNHAMQLTKGELIAIFDCDHIASRTFLQETVAPFLFKPHLALIQTPHHFYSPDPFQRNFSHGAIVPPEGNLFYGLIQDGNDFWNATFFCGSCAVIRRAALEEIGGVAVETVTEDMHTALKLQRRGWSTAYLAKPLAAGLSTERLILHVGQRMRWARGMLQILRLDNPLTGPGLNFAQRLCYFAAIASFLFAIPRLIFLTSPMAYLLFNQTLIDASPFAIAIYAVPHLIHSVVTSARTNRNWRYSLWSEVYETTLAPFLARVSIMTLIFPRRGKFNVTEKGGLLDRSYLDWSAIYPNVYLAVALFASLGVGLFRLAHTHHDTIVTNALLMNILWITVSIVIVLAAISIGRESMQIRRSHRVEMVIPVTVCTADGRMFQYTSENMSSGGGMLHGHAPAEALPDNSLITVIVPDRNETYALPAKVIRATSQGTLALSWTTKTILQEAQIVRVIFGRRDAWASWADYRPDSLPRSILLLLRSIVDLFKPATFRKRKTVVSLKPRTVQSVPQKTAVIVRPKAGLIKIIVLSMGVGTMLAAPCAKAQQSAADLPMPTGVGALPGPTQTAAAPPPSQPPAGTVPASPISAAPSAPEPPPVTPAATGGLLQPSGSSGAQATADMPGTAREELENARTTSWSFSQLGSADTLIMTAWIPIQGLNFGVPSSEVVTAATLTLHGSMSPDMLPAGSGVTIFLNDQFIGVIHPDKAKPQFDGLAFTINPLFFKEHNVLTFHFAGQYTLSCGDQTSAMLWAKVLGQSSLSITSAPLPPSRDLATLPAPFFNEAVLTPARVPFVIARQSSPHTLEASAILASWFGAQSDYRGASFPVLSQLPPSGGAVLVGPASGLGQMLAGQAPVSGPTVIETVNANDPFGAILIVTGRTDDEVLAAARSVAFSSKGFPHESRINAPPVTIEPRTPFDAPGFVSRGQPIRIGDLVSLSTLQGYGYVPGTISVPFRTTPDIYTWRSHPLSMHFTVRGPLGTEIDRQRSHVDVSVNGIYLKSVSLAPPSELPGWLRRLWPDASRAQSAHVSIPPWAIYGANTLGFYLESRPIGRRDCSGMTQDLRMSIDPDSTIDLTRAYHYTQLPNLAFFANSGFPFTRMADLSDTAIVLPANHSEGVESAFLDLVGMIGASTHFPVSGLTVLHADAVSETESRNLIVMDTSVSSSAVERFLRGTPYSFSGTTLNYTRSGILAPFRLLARSMTGGDEGGQASTLQALGATTSLGDGGALIERHSPFSSNATMLLMLSENPQGLERLIQAMRNSKTQPMIQGDLALINGTHILATRNLPTYSIGSVPFWFWPDLYLGDHPFRVILLAVVGVGLGVLILFPVLTNHARRRARELHRDR